MRHHRIRSVAATAVILAIAIFALFGHLAEAQQPPQCRPIVKLESQLRRVTGSVMAECAGGIHSAPFGNWGVETSLPSRRNNRDQFRGWNPRTGIEGQWNSCTDHFPTRTNNGYRKQKADPDDRVSGWKLRPRGDAWERCEDFVPEVYHVNDVKLMPYELDPGPRRPENHHHELRRLRHREQTAPTPGAATGRPSGACSNPLTRPG